VKQSKKQKKREKKARRRAEIHDNKPPADILGGRVSIGSWEDIYNEKDN